MNDHERWMQHAIGLAKRGTSFVSPNPRVGCVIVSNDKVIAEGWHKKYGDLHAEAHALSTAPAPIPDDAILYVNLEPCAHYGKRPPCAEAVVGSGIKTVVVGCVDPFEKVSGKGIQIMEDAGIEVIVGVLEKEALEVNRWFIHNVEHKRPYVIAKLGQGIDGGIAPIPRKRLQLTSPQSTERVHQLRSKVDAVMVGATTVELDNPKLTSRIPKGIDPIRVIVDPEGRIPEYSAIAVHASSDTTMIITGKERPQHPLSLKATMIRVNDDDTLDLKKALEMMYKHNVGSVLCEGGAELVSSLLEEGLVDELRIHVAPIVLGDALRLSTPVLDTFYHHGTDVVGPDVHITYRRKA